MVLISIKKNLAEFERHFSEVRPVLAPRDVGFHESQLLARELAAGVSLVENAQPKYQSFQYG
jgi:hypothetical protein